MFSLFDLHFGLWSLHLHVLRTQRILGFCIVITHNATCVVLRVRLAWTLERGNSVLWSRSYFFYLFLKTLRTVMQRALGSIFASWNWINLFNSFAQRTIRPKVIFLQESARDQCRSKEDYFVYFRLTVSGHYNNNNNNNSKRSQSTTVGSESLRLRSPLMPIVSAW